MAAFDKSVWTSEPWGRRDIIARPSWNYNGGATIRRGLQLKDYIAYGAFAVIYALGFHGEVNEVILFKSKEVAQSLLWASIKRNTYNFIRVRHEDAFHFEGASRPGEISDDRMTFFGIAIVFDLPVVLTIGRRGRVPSRKIGSVCT